MIYFLKSYGFFIAKHHKVLKPYILDLYFQSCQAEKHMCTNTIR